jgi:hypothetical protein
MPNTRQYFRFATVLCLETPPTAVRAQPSWFSSLASLNPPKYPFSPLTASRFLIVRTRTQTCVAVSELLLRAIGRSGGQRLIAAHTAGSARKTKFDAAQPWAHKRYDKAFQRLAE